MKQLAKNRFGFFVVAVALLLTCCSNEDNNTNEIAEIRLNKSVLGIFIGENYTLSVTSPTDNYDIEWSSNKTDIATVNSQGIVSGLSEGTAVITSKIGDSKAICTAVITKKTYELELNQDNLRLYPYPKYAQILEVLTDLEGNEVIWESSDPGVATVDQNGNVTPIAIGETTVTAKFDDFFVDCPVEVVEGPVTLLELSNTELIMKTFRMAQLSITTLESELEEIGQAIWESSDEEIVSVNSEGELTSFGQEGSATISVTVDNLTSECIVTVTPETVYVAGFDGEKAVLWKDNAPTYLTGDDDAEAEFVYVMDEDNIYTTGHVGPTNSRSILLWNNDQVSYTLTDGTKDAKGKAILFHNDNFYTTGYEDDDGGEKIAKIWENDQVLYELTDGENDALTYTIFEDSGNFYTAGYEKDAEGDLVAKVWENNQEKYVLTNGDYNAIAYSANILDNNIYAAGYEKNNDGKFIAKVWRNDNELYSYSDGTYTTIAYSLDIHNGSIYVAGYDYSGDKRVATIWRDGAQLYALTNGSEHARAYAVYVTDNGDVYAAGYEENGNGDEVAKVWKNGVQHMILTDGSGDARAYSIVVQ
ncbi:MAG: Ig-like domain-containing protein [Allomuricauda sp.]